jgi:hypothetical protein
MVNSRLQWAWVRSSGSNHTNGGDEVLAGAPTQVDELRQPAAARRSGGRHAAPTRPRVPRTHARAHSPRQVRGSQFEYASSLAPADLVRNHHHHEVALRQVSTGRRGGRPDGLWSTTATLLLRDEVAGEAYGSCPTHWCGSCDPCVGSRDCALRESGPGRRARRQSGISPVSWVGSGARLLGRGSTATKAVLPPRPPQSAPMVGACSIRSH